MEAFLGAILSWFAIPLLIIGVGYAVYSYCKGGGPILWSIVIGFVLVAGYIFILLVKTVCRLQIRWSTKWQRWTQNIREPEVEKQRRERNKQLRKPTTED